jgi:hypothetical protein
MGTRCWRWLNALKSTHQSCSTSVVLNAGMKSPGCELTNRSTHSRRTGSRGEDLRQAPRDSGFVVAVTGQWGEGKTSLINMVANLLRESGDAEIVYFNPWLFSGTEQLVDHFFDELAGQLRETGSTRLSRVGAALERYGHIVRPMRAVPVVGEVLGASGDLALGVAEGLTPDQPTARARAADLRKRLVELDRRIVVVVDDLDRLRPDEIIDVMRLVRLVGDFPNLVYLLAFDRPIVEMALGSDDRRRGRTYLEKIVQVSHQLPQVRDQALTSLLTEDLSAAIGDTSKYRFDAEHFKNVFWGGTRQLFQTVRDVRRYINVLPATLELVGDEVDLGDVLALEGLRVFVPDAFSLIADNPEAFTTPSRAGYGLREEEENEAAEVVRRAVEAASDRFNIRFVIQELFPSASRHLGGSHYGTDWLATWRRQCRVANPDVFAVYLQRRVPPGTVRAAVAEAVFESLEDETRLDRLLSSLDEAELEQVLTRLQSYVEEFPGERPSITLSVLSRHGRRLPRGARSMSDFGADVELGRVFYRLLRGLDAKHVEVAVDEAEFADFSTWYEVVRIVGHREGAGHQLVDPDTANRLETKLAERLSSASAGDVADEPDLGPLVGFIIDKLPDRGPELVQTWADNDEFFVRLLRSRLMVSLGNTVGKPAVRRTTQLNWYSLISVLGEDLARRRVQELDPDWVRREFDDDASDALKQALFYIENPERAERDLKRWPSPFGEEDDDETTTS